MKIVTEHVSDARVCMVHMQGDIDMTTVRDVRTAVESALNRGCANLVLDLSRVTYADSAALSLIVWIDRALAPGGGKLVLAGATRNVARILELSGLVGVAPTVSAASDAADAVAGLELPERSDEPVWTRTLELPADSSSLARIRSDVCDLLGSLSLSETTMFDIRVAVGEALSNAIRHGSPAGGEDTIAVDVRAYPDRVALVVKDRGAGFDGDASASGDPYAASGRGVMFMRALMDQVEFERLAEGGTAVTLVKHIGDGFRVT